MTVSVRAWVCTGVYDTHVDVTLDGDGAYPARLVYRGDDYEQAPEARQYPGTRRYQRVPGLAGLW